MFESMLSFAKETLEKSGAELSTHGYPYRKRSEHIRRVYLWAERLSESEPDINRDALLAAAALHDIGYSSMGKGEGHALSSADLSRTYLEEKGFDPEFIELVYYLIANHSNKKLLSEPQTPKELIMLLEADLLDETGALAIVWDCMEEGSQPVQSFPKTYAHLQKYACEILNENPMVTPMAKEFWKKKQQLIAEFMEQYAFDLEPFSLT